MTKPAEPTVSTDELIILNWLKALLEFKGHGAKAQAARDLDISDSVLSKILKRNSGFDPKTIRLMSLIMSSKDQMYEHLPVTEQWLHAAVHQYLLLLWQILQRLHQPQVLLCR